MIQAEARLGEDFDIRRFHDPVLEDGAVPVDYLRMKIERWIEEEAERVPEWRRSR